MRNQSQNCSRKRYRLNFKFNVDTTAYCKDEYQNLNVTLFTNVTKLRFMSGRHVFIIPLTSAQKCYALLYLNYICPPFLLILCKFSLPYCLWLCCLCLGPSRTNDERKGNTTTNSKGKKVCTIPNKRLGQYSLDLLPICFCLCRVAKKIKTVNICIAVSAHIKTFLTVNKLLQTVLALISKDHLESFWVEAYLFPFTKNVWNQNVTLFIYTVKIVYYNEWLLYSFSINKKINIHKSNHWLLFYYICILQQHNCLLWSVNYSFSSLIIRLFVETETAKWKQGFPVISSLL